MHELSVAQSVVEIVSTAVPKESLSRVTAVRMKVGTMAGVVPESLEFSFQAITAGTVLEHACLTIETIPFRVQCHDCGATSEEELGVVICSQCGSANTTILSGNELYVSEIEVDDARE